VRVGREAKSRLGKQYVLRILTINVRWIFQGKDWDYKNSDSYLHTWNVLFFLKDEENNSRKLKITRLMEESNNRG
jgi:hypothetical protein